MSIAEKVLKNEIILDMSSMECRPFLSGGVNRNILLLLSIILETRYHLMDQRDPVES